MLRWASNKIKSPHSEPSLECSEDAGLTRSAIKGASSIQATFKRVRVMIFPIAIKYIFETFPEEWVFPSLDRSSYTSISILNEKKQIDRVSKKYDTRTIDMRRVEVEGPFRTWFSDPKSIGIGQWDI
jgi:hypothetical protein